MKRAVTSHYKTLQKVWALGILKDPGLFWILQQKTQKKNLLEVVLVLEEVNTEASSQGSALFCVFAQLN